MSIEYVSPQISPTTHLCFYQVINFLKVHAAELGWRSSRPPPRKPRLESRRLERRGRRGRRGPRRPRDPRGPRVRTATRAAPRSRRPTRRGTRARPRPRAATIGTIATTGTGSANGRGQNLGNETFASNQRVISDTFRICSCGLTLRHKLNAGIFPNNHH